VFRKLQGGLLGQRYRDLIGKKVTAYDLSRVQYMGKNQFAPKSCKQGEALLQD